MMSPFFLFLLQSLRLLDLFSVFRFPSYDNSDDLGEPLPSSTSSSFAPSSSSTSTTDDATASSNSADEKRNADANEEAKQAAERLQLIRQRPELDPSNVLIQEVERLQKEESFRRFADGALRDAEDAQARDAQANKIPTWLLVLLVFLGWDDFFSLLKSPLKLIFVVFFGTIAYVVFFTPVGAPLKIIIMVRISLFKFPSLSRLFYF